MAIMIKQLSSHRKIIMLAFLVSGMVFSGFEYAYADNGSSLANGGIYLAVFIVAGVVWSLSGYINGIRSHANYEKVHPNNSPPDPDWKGFDPKAMKDDVFIGLILGVVAFVVNGSNAIPDISTIQSFMAAVVASYGLIGLTDKIGVGAILNK